MAKPDDQAKERHRSKSGAPSLKCLVFRSAKKHAGVKWRTSHPSTLFS